MAFATRFFSRSPCQVYTRQMILQTEQVISASSFAKSASSAPPALKGDEMLKGIFLEVKKKFETALGVLRKEKITINPDDPAAVFEYARVMKIVREKALETTKAFKMVEPFKLLEPTQTATANGMAEMLGFLCSYYEKLSQLMLYVRSTHLHVMSAVLFFVHLFVVH